MEAGGDVNGVNEQKLTAMHSAASLGWDNTIKLLVDGGALLEAQDSKGMTPIDYAVGRHRARVPRAGAHAQGIDHHAAAQLHRRRDGPPAEGIRRHDQRADPRHGRGFQLENETRRSRGLSRLAAAARRTSIPRRSIPGASSGRQGARQLDELRAHYDEQRFSPLEQINESNVGELGLAWFYDSNTFRGIEGTPLVVDGVHVRHDRVDHRLRARCEDRQGAVALRPEGAAASGAATRAATSSAAASRCGKARSSSRRSTAASSRSMRATGKPSGRR